MYSTENYIQYPLIYHMGKNMKKNISNHLAIYQKLTQHCKSIILKKKKKALLMISMCREVRTTVLPCLWPSCLLLPYLEALPVLFTWSPLAGPPEGLIWKSGCALWPSLCSQGCFKNTSLTPPTPSILVCGLSGFPRRLYMGRDVASFLWSSSFWNGAWHKVGAW